MKLRMSLFLSAIVAIALGTGACETGTNSNMASASPTSTNTPAVARPEPTLGTGRGQYTEEQARKEREQAKGNKETIGQSLDDAWIHTKIVAKLIGDKTTPERNINVDVVEGTVTLRGNVDTADAKTEAERLAKDTEGVTRVINQLKVVASQTGNANKAVKPKTK
jgi:hyperosmotically inducible periplasmic protein